MIELENRIKDFDKLTDIKKIQKVLLMLNELKNKGDDFEYTYNYINSNKSNISINLINKIFISISEAIIYQNILTLKDKEELEEKIKSKLDYYKKQEAEEREIEKENIDNILIINHI